MTVSEDEDESLAHFLESEVLCEASDQEKEAAAEPPQAKRLHVDGEESKRSAPKRIETGIFTKIPPELFHHILKFLSSEDLVACSLVCRFLNYAASDEGLWRRLYCMRWGLVQPSKKFRECAWKKLYIEMVFDRRSNYELENADCLFLAEFTSNILPHMLSRRDEEDIVEFVRNCPSEFKEYYIQMHVAKRSQAPQLSQVNDDRIILDKTVADQVSIWKNSRGLTDKMDINHNCSGVTCTYYQIGDVFVCEKTGRVHVCDDTCREVVMDTANDTVVCTISGHCFDRLLVSDDEPDNELQQGGLTDEAEPFMGSGRFARAYLLGYNCADEKELEAALRFC